MFAMSGKPSSLKSHIETSSSVHPRRKNEEEEEKSMEKKRNYVLAYPSSPPFPSLPYLSSTTPREKD